MPDRLLVDLGADGRVSVVPWREGEFPAGVAGEAQEVTWPLDADALEELRWYLEDYLRAPFGVYESRGPQAAGRLEAWGEAVFGAVFGGGGARDAYKEARARGAGVQLVFRSEVPGWLGLPWELMRDPAGGLPLALEVAGMDRSVPAAELGAAFEVAGGQLRVLMVISRPAGAADVGFQMIARPLLARLEAVRGNVDLVVLRPPTLDALAAVLGKARAAGEPFQVVHFDGHGVLAGRRLAGVGAAGMFQDAAAEGVLLFQGVDGEADRVPASRVAQVLAAAQVPVVVLNACQSGAVGKELEAAVATRLLQGGAASVVAMAYSVYAVAAAEFMAAFYEQLFGGDTVSSAVTAGRQHLFRHDRRPSPKGELPLADWLVPVHYLRREVRFPGLAIHRPPGAPSLEQALDQLRGASTATDGGALAAAGGVFTGRDGLFYELETAARLQHVIVLHGPAGTGKTELAKAFGRWWQDTGGVERPGWVFWHSFEPGLASFGLAGVINAIGLAVFGSNFARLDAADRTGVVGQFLRERRALLIWDNFETVYSLPDPSAGPLEEAGRAQMRGFLHELAAGAHSTVLITSRTTEPWLDEVSRPGPGALRRIAVGGLLPSEAAEYADELLAPYPAAAPRRAGRAFGELMAWLDGHPLSMRLVLPHLDTTGPKALLDGLHGTAPLPGWEQALAGRNASLPASLGYSYTHLDPAIQELLTPVSLFHGVADADVLAVLSGINDVPRRFAGITREQWTAALDAAAGTGLLTALGGGMYRLHPALPAYLAALWRSQDPAGYDAQRAATTRALLAAYAVLGRWLRQQIVSRDAGFAYTLIGLQERTMGSLLGYALDYGHCAEAQQIAEPLDVYWEARGRYAEADAWTDRVRLAVEDPGGAPPALDSPAGELWLFFAGAQATRQMYSGQLDKAQRTQREILAMLEAQPDSPSRQHRLAVTYHLIGSAALEQRRLDEAKDWYTRSAVLNEELGNQPRLAMCYHQLGMVAQDRGRLEEAEDWYTRSLAIEEELGDRPGQASSYHQLGMVAQFRGRLEEAEDWYTRAVAIREELGDRPKQAVSYHNLGAVAQDRGRLEEAEGWYIRSLTIKEELGDRPGQASSYHQLGIVAQFRGRLEEAEDWYTRAVAIEEELGDRLKRAASYHNLGMVAQLRGRLEEAEDWYTRSLTIKEEIGDRPGQASTYHMLGMVAQLRGQLEEAEDWYTRATAIAKELGDRPKIALAYSQLGLLAEQRQDLTGALEWAVRCVALFDNVDLPGAGTGLAQLARLTSQLGIQVLEKCWHQVTGQPLAEPVRAYVRTYRPQGSGAAGGGETDE